MDGASGPTALYELTDVAHAYESGRQPALRNIRLTIMPGEFVALAGPSGSGKTTLLNLLAMIERPQAGELRFEDRPVTGFDEQELTRIRRGRLGYLLQTLNLIPVLTAYENVEYFLLRAPMSAASRRERVRGALAATGVAELADRRPSEMSGGQRQRVALARILAREVPVVLADEPTAALDRETALSVIGLMKSLHRERGVTFIFSSHDPDILAAAGRVITLRDGRILP